jgi:15-cis-phytoene synthase
MSQTAAHVPSAAAEATLARQGRSFHWARRLLGATHADRATRLYAFCRRLDDLVDEASSPEEARVALAAADRAIADGRSDDPILCDGLALMRECGIETGIVRELIAGMASDAETVRMADEAELLRYCYRAAGTVGLMMCRVLDAPEPAAAAHAVDLGIAMQLTNLCRDVAADARMGRRYLPASLVGDIAPADLIEPSPALQPALRAAVARLLALAEVYYASGEAGLPFLPVRARAGILVAGRVYRAIGHRLAASEHAYWQGRAFVPDWRKATITLTALTTQPLRGAFWSRPTSHHGQLHRALVGLPGITACHGE